MSDCKICNIWKNSDKRTLWFRNDPEYMVIQDLNDHGEEICILAFFKNHEYANTGGAIHRIEEIAGEYADRLLEPGYKIDRDLKHEPYHFHIQFIGRGKWNVINKAGY